MKAADFFANPSAAGILLSLAFGAVWLAALAPAGWRRPVSWLIFLVGAAVFVPAIAWIQAPLQKLIGEAEMNFFGPVALQTNVLLLSIPVILVTGIIQEGMKFLPTVFYWGFHHRSISPKLGLSLGAMAGAGFGIIEAQWVLNSVFASGWHWGLIDTYGVTALAGFWERFFTVGFHISLGALTGYGLARGWGWQGYLAAAGVHSLSNYFAVFYQQRMLTITQIEIVIAVTSVIMFIIVARWRWRHNPEEM